MKTRLFIIVIITLGIQSCKPQNYIDKTDTVEIINLILPKEDSVYLFEEAYNKKEPKFVINQYYRIFNSNKNSASYELFYKGKDSLINIEELKEMEVRYKSWQKIRWNEKIIINKNIELISMQYEKTFCNRRTYRIYEPLYTEDKLKAIVLNYSGNKIGGGGIVISIFKKENGKWKYKGGIPVGTSD